MHFTLILCATMLAILMQYLSPLHSGSFICNLNLWLPSFLQKLQYETYFSLQRKIAILIAILLQRKSHLDSRHFDAVTFSIGKCTIKAQSVQSKIHCTKRPDGKRYNIFHFAFYYYSVNHQSDYHILFWYIKVCRNF